MQARIDSLYKLVPEGMKALVGVEEFLRGSSLPHSTHELVKLRASQINGCGFCVDMHSRDAKESGESDERLFTVAAWRESPHFTAAERAALALTESATRISDDPDGVPDDVWDEAARHYDEETLAQLIMAIATINAFNRLNVAARRPAGARP